MGSQWFYSKNRQQFGPISAQELKQLADTGQLSPTDIVWKEGIKDGFAANKIAGLFSKAQPQQATTATAPPPTPPPPPQSAAAKASQVPPPLPPEIQFSTIARASAHGDTKAVNNASKFLRKMPVGGWIIASILLLWLSLLTQYFPLIALMLCLLAVAVCYQLLPTVLRASQRIGTAKIPKEPTEAAAQNIPIANKPLSAGAGCLIVGCAVLLLIVCLSHEKNQSPKSVDKVATLDDARKLIEKLPTSGGFPITNPDKLQELRRKVSGNTSGILERFDELPPPPLKRASKMGTRFGS